MSNHDARHDVPGKSPDPILSDSSKQKQTPTVEETVGTPMAGDPRPYYFKRHFTSAGEDPFSTVKWTKRHSLITNPDGSVIFELKDVEVPDSWSQLATDIVVSKYFRKAGIPKTGHETSVRQVIYRVAHTIRQAGETQGGYFQDREEADTFEAELSYMLLHQIGAFNSPVWFNVGLKHVYGITGQGGNWAIDPKTDQVEPTTDAYSRPQSSACFIQSVEDDLMSIFELAKTEARLFKYGSGTGSNFSKLRGRDESLSGGGKSSGLMSFLEVLDRGAGSIKSGGTTRRAAKMVVLDVDHPEILEFIHWKSKEEKKARRLVDAGFDVDEAYRTVSGQNANNSVRVNDAFMKAVESDGDWTLTYRKDQSIVETMKAKDLLAQMAQSAWECGDPGLQYDTHINHWHTCKKSGRINASNPCSEYMFLDNSACNLASLNLTKFLDSNGEFSVEAFRHAVSVFFIAQEILVDLASYPTGEIANNSHRYRPLGLGFANLGTLLMRLGLPYHSPEGQTWAGAITSLMTGQAYAISAAMAQRKGPFPAFQSQPRFHAGSDRHA